MSDTLDDQAPSYQDYQDQIERRSLPIQPSTQAGFRPTSPGVLSPDSSGGAGGALGGFSLPKKTWAPAKDDAVVGPGYEFTPPPPASEAKGGYFGDMARQVWTSTLQSGDAALGIAAGVANQLKASPDTQAWLQEQRRALAGHVEATIRDMSPERQIAARSSLTAWMGGDKDSEGNRIPAPGEGGWLNYAGLTVASLIPDAVLAALGGYAAGPLGVAALFAGKGAGNTFNALSDKLESIPDKALQASSPAYQTLRQQGMGEQDAKLELLRHMAPSLVAAGGAAGAVAGYGVGRTASGALEKTLGTTLTRRLAIGAVEGGVPMGVQGGADPAIQQTFEQELGQRQGYDTGQIAAGAASGAAGGALMGAGFGAFRAPHTASKPTAEPGANTTQVDPAQTEALQEALKPSSRPRTPEQVMTSQPAGFGASPQAEMFQPHEMDPNAPRPGMGMPPGAQQGELGLPEPRPVQTGPRTPEQVMTSQPAGPGAGGQGEMFQPYEMRPGQPPGPGVAPGAQQGEMFPAPGAGNTQGQREMFPPTEMGPGRPQDGVPPEAQQGDLFAPQPAPAPASPATPARPAIPSRPATPATPTNAPTQAMSRAQLVKALTEAGQDPQVLAKTSLGDLRAMHEALNQPAVNTVRKPAATKPEQATQLPETPATGTPAPETPAPETPAPETPAQKRDRIRAEMKAKVATKAEPPVPAEPIAVPAEPVIAKHIATPEEIAATARQAPGAEAEAPRQTTAKAPEVAAVGGKKLTPAEIRAQRKAAMAAPGAPVRGTAATLEGTTAPIADDAAAARQTQLRKDGLARDLPGAVRSVVSANKGVNIETLINRLVHNLHGQLAKTDASPEAVTELLTNWADKMPAGKLPGTGTAPREIADHLIQKFGVREQTRAEAEKIAELHQHQAEESPSRFETEGQGREAAVEDRGAEAGGEKMEVGEAAQDVRERAASETAEAAAAGEKAGSAIKTEEAPEEAQRAETTSLKRRAERLLDDLHDGKKDVHQADAAFGKQAEGAGRRRGAGLESFAHVLEAEARRAEDPAEIQKWIKKVERSQQAEMAGSEEERNAKRALTLAVEREGHRLGPVYADQIRAHLRELTDPVGVAADREAAKAEPVQAIDHLDAAHGQTLLQRARTLAAKYANAAKNSHEEQAANDLRRVAKDIEGLLRDKQDGDGSYLERRLERQNLFRTSRWDYAKMGLGDVHKFAEDLNKWALDAENAADKAEQAKPGRHAWTPPADGIAPLSSRYVRTSLDARLGAVTAGALEASERHGVPFTANDALRNIQNSSLLSAEAAPAQRLATQLLRLRAKLPDIPIYSMERMVEDGRIDPLAEDFNSYGLFQMDTANRLDHDHIVLNTRVAHAHGNHTTTVLHEVSHSVTGRLIQDMIDHEKATGETPAELSALQAIHNELLRHVEAAEDLTKQQRENLEHALSDPHELHTMLMTDPTVHGFAASKQASPKLLSELRQAGFPTGSQPRSVWRSFVDWTRRILGMRAPASASEYTFLDHVFQPISEIAERAAKYNERFLPKDPVLREPAADLYRASTASLAWSPKAREAFDRAPKFLDFRTLGDKARRVLLQGMTTDAIVSRYRGVMGKSVDGFRAAQEAIARTQKVFFDQHADKVSALVDRYNKNPEGIKLGQLMTDATRNEARLGDADPKANAHLTSPDEQAALAELTKRYNALSPESRALYQDFKQTYAEFYKRSRDAELTALFRGALPEATEAQLDTYRKEIRSAKTLEKFLAKPENAAIEASFGADKFQTYKQVLRGVAKIYAQGHVAGDYFPLRRNGEYVVTYGHAGEENHGVEMFHSVSEAEARRAELVKAGEENVSQVMSKRTNPLSEILPHHPMVDELAQDMRKNPNLRGHAEDVRNLLNSILLEHLDRRTASSTRMRRKGVRGALADHGRILANEMLNTGGRLGHYEHGQDRLDALSAMRERVTELGRSGGDGEALLGGAVLHELQQRAATIEHPDSMLASIGAKANVASYSLNVMSMSHMLTGSIEAHSNAVPLLTARHGLTAPLALTKAMVQVAPKMIGVGVQKTLAAMGNKLKASDWNLSHYVRDRFVEGGANQAHMNRLFGELENAGLIDHTMSNDIRLMANPSGAVSGRIGKGWEIFKNFNAAGAHAVDVMNKGAIAKAAFDLEMRKSKGDVNQSIAYAVELARQVMPNYNYGNKARIATAKGVFGQLGSPMMQFKNYGFHEMGVLANLAKQAFSGLKGEARTQARYQLAGVLATRAMMAGSLTLIADPLRYVMGAYDWFSGADKPHDYQADTRHWVAGWAGPELGAVLTRGLPYALGMDIHRRVGLANILEIPELKSFDSSGMKEMLVGAAFGASGENAANISQGLSKLMHGDPMGALAFTPRPIRDAIKAINLTQQGITDSRGQTILPPDKLSASDFAYQAAGFQPARVSEFREGRNAVLERREEIKAERTRLVSKWLSASPDQRQDIMHQIHDFSADPANAGQRITMGQLLKAQRERQKQSKAPFGLKLPRRGGAALAEAGDFAAY